MIGPVIGVIYGIDIPDLTVQMKPLDDGLIGLIKMLITLIVSCVMVSDISGAGNLKKVGRIGLKLVIYFEILATITLALGLVIAHSLGPDSGVNIHLNGLPVGDVALYAGRTREIHGPVALLIGLIPTSVFSAFTENDILRALLLSVLLGSALNLVGEQVSDIAHLISEFSRIVFRITGMIVRLTPFSMFGTVTFIIARYGASSLNHLDMLVPVFYATYLVFTMVVLGSTLRLSEVRMLPFLCRFREELMIVMGTVSSDAMLPQVMRKSKYMGTRSSTVSLVIPTGYSFSLDRFSICLTLAVVLIAHVTGTPLVMADLVTILLVLLVASKGAHGIPGPALMILAATLTVVPAVPVAGLMLVLSMDRFMDISRVLTNLIGSCVVTVIIARWENDIDMPRAQAIPNGRLEAPAEVDGELLKCNAVAGEGKLHS